MRKTDRTASPSIVLFQGRIVYVIRHNASSFPDNVMCDCAAEDS